MWRHKRRNQIRSSSETDESIYIGGGVSSVEYWLSWSAGRRKTIVVALDGLFRVKLKTVGYPLHSPLSSSLLLPCVAVCHQIPFFLRSPNLRTSRTREYKQPPGKYPLPTQSKKYLPHKWNKANPHPVHSPNVREPATTDYLPQARKPKSTHNLTTTMNGKQWEGRKDIKPPAPAQQFRLPQL